MRADLRLSTTQLYALYAIAIGLWVLNIILLASVIVGAEYLTEMIEVLNGLNNTLRSG